MIFLAFLLHLSFFILITVVIGIYANTTIQLLLVVIVVVFLQGLILLSLGNSIIGSYIIIIYIGAIVILFAFCILFINTKELVKENKKNLNPNQSLKGVKIMFFLFLILT
jgi:NADH:ubiquinone oxidoreductase subunit 6 (subunit J)